MKAFRNPLANVLAVRRIQQRQRETELYAAVRDRDREQETLDRIVARQQAAMRYVPGGPEPTAGQALLLRDRFVEHQRRLARQQRQALATAQTVVDERQGHLVEARREVRTFEVHRDRLLERWRVAMLRDEQLRSDDIVAAQRAVRLADEPGEEASADPSADYRSRA